MGISMEDGFAAMAQPGGKGLSGGGGLPRSGEQMGGAAAGAERFAGRIARGEPIGPPPAFEFFKGLCHPWREGEQLLDGRVGGRHTSNEMMSAGPWRCREDLSGGAPDSDRAVWVAASAARRAQSGAPFHTSLARRGQHPRVLLPS